MASRLVRFRTVPLADDAGTAELEAKKRSWQRHVGFCESRVVAEVRRVRRWRAERDLVGGSRYLECTCLSSLQRMVLD